MCRIDRAIIGPRQQTTTATAESEAANWSNLEAR